MAAQYFAAAILTTAHWPLGMAAALLVAGWMSVAALGMTSNCSAAPHPRPIHPPRARFDFMAGWCTCSPRPHTTH
jgi:hypothetical protein